MTPATYRLVRLVFRVLVRGWRTAAALWVLALVERGALGWPAVAEASVRRHIGPIEGPPLFAAAVLLGALGSALVRRLRRPPQAPPPPVRHDWELGAAGMAACFAVVQATGGPDSSAYPLVYLAGAAAVLFLQRGAALAVVALGLAADAAQFWGLGVLAARWPTLAAHAAFLATFAALYHALLGVRLNAARSAEKTAVESRIREAEQRAREYRLIVGSSRDPTPAHEQKAKWTLAAVAEVETAVHSALEVAVHALEPHTAAVFLLTSDDQSLVLRECLGHADGIARRVRAGEGVLGSVVKRKAPVRLAGDIKNAGSYQDGTRVQALCAVPLLDGEFVRGVLVADRLEKKPFEERDEKLLGAVAREILRAIEVERVMGYIRKEKDEKERFFHAIEELNKVSKPGEVASKLVELARGFCEIDLLALTLAHGKTHKVALAVGEGADTLQGLEFADNGGLVSNVVKLGVALPGRDVRAMEHVAPFDARTVLKGLGSLKIFPLRAGDGVAGTLLCACKRKDAFNDDVQRMLGVIALQAGEAFTRARLFEATERMATTDGLTGLTNHRTFQAVLEGALVQAQRYGKRVSVLLTDIDHFKTVNDTYGHPAGDLVLKGVANVLAGIARATDVCARYGGEEFAVVMPETDAAGALIMAERIRKAVAAEQFQTELGTLGVTLSIGAATFPEDAPEKGALVEKADQALYQAKRTGRNRSITFGSLRARRSA